MFKIDRVVIISCYGTISDNDRKPPFSVFLWQLQGQNGANMVQKRINSEHSSNKCTHQVWIGLREYVFPMMVGNHHFQ